MALVVVAAVAAHRPVVVAAAVAAGVALAPHNSPFAEALDHRWQLVAKR